MKNIFLSRYKIKYFLIRTFVIMSVISFVNYNALKVYAVYYPSDHVINPSCPPSDSTCCVSLLPDQTGNVGKLFYTNGTSPAWTSSLYWDSLNSRFGIGTNTPMALLHLGAGTHVANTAPLKFTSGINLSTPEPGAMEYDGTSLFFSPSTTRYNVLLAGLGLSGGQTIIGSNSTNSGLTLRSTSGIGANGADIVFQTGNNGGTEAMRILNNGNVGIGTNNPRGALDVSVGKIYGDGSRISGIHDIYSAKTPSLINKVIWEDSIDTIGSGNWTVSSNSSITTDNSNAISGNSSIAMTTINTSDASMVKQGLNINLSAPNVWFKVRFYVPSSSVQNTSLIYLTIQDVSGNNRCYYFWYPNPNGKSGWSEVSLPISTYSYAGGSIDLKAVTKVFLSIDPNGSSVSTVTFDDITFFYPKQSRGKILVGFDGTYTDQLKAMQFLSKRNLKGSLFTNGNYLDVGGHLSTSQLKVLSRAGHYVGLYAGSYYVNLWASLSDTEKVDVIQQAQDWAYQNGFYEGSRALSISGVGGWTETDDTVLLKKYIDFVTGGDMDGSYKQHLALNDPHASLSWFNGQSATQLLPSQNFTQLVSNATSTDGTIIYWGHLNNTNGDTEAAFETNMNIAIAAGLEFITPSEYLEPETVPSPLNILNGNIGVGASPLTRFQVTDSQSTSSVEYLVNTDTSTTSEGLRIGLGAASAGSTNLFTSFYQGSTSGVYGTKIGSISGTGSNGVAYNTTSDARLKQNIVDTKDGLDKLMNIHVKDFNFIGSNKTIQGFIAQDLYKTYPYAVSTNGDDGVMPLGLESTPWMVDYGRLTPLLVKSVQDLDLKLNNIDTLDFSKEKSVGSLIKKLLADTGNQIVDIYAHAIHSYDIQTENIHTKNLCIDEVCINKDQLIRIMNSSNIEQNIIIPTPVAPVITPSDATSSESIVIPVDGPVPEPILPTSN